MNSVSVYGFFLKRLKGLHSNFQRWKRFVGGNFDKQVFNILVYHLCELDVYIFD